MKNDSKNFGEDFSYEDLVSVLGSALSDFSERIDYENTAEKVFNRFADEIDDIDSLNADNIDIQRTLCSLFYDFLKKWVPRSSIVSINEDGEEYELSSSMARKIVRSVITLNLTKAIKLIYRVVGHEDVFDDMVKELRRAIKKSEELFYFLISRIVH